MASLQTISDSLAIARAYYVELLAAYILLLKNGCDDKKQYAKLKCLDRLITYLTSCVYGDVNNDTTTANYKNLLNLISTYSGSALVVNPDVVIPGTTITVQSALSIPPERKYFTNSDTPSIADWQGVYASRFGNNPTLAIFLDNGSGFYTQDVSASPTLEFNGTETLLLSVQYGFGIPQTGYILIST